MPPPSNTNSPTDSGKPKTSSFKPRALVVDDSADAADILKLMLETLGYETHVADNGIEGLKMAVDEKPDLILLDICMPQLSGYDTCRVIRGQPWGHDVCIVAVTGRVPEEIPSRSEKAGFNDYLIKPVELESLRTIARNSAISTAEKPSR